jgi:hypothetical protein
MTFFAVSGENMRGYANAIVATGQTKIFSSKRDDYDNA